MTKKKGVFLTGIAVLIVIGIVFICVWNSDSKNVKEDNSQMNNQIEILAEENSYKVGIEVIEFEVLNHSEKELILDEKYKIEFFANGSWVDVKLDFSVDDLQINIDTGESRLFEFYLYPEQFNYVEGQYRVVKTATIGEESITLLFDFELTA